MTEPIDTTDSACTPGIIDITTDTNKQEDTFTPVTESSGLPVTSTNSVHSNDESADQNLDDSDSDSDSDSEHEHEHEHEHEYDEEYIPVAQVNVIPMAREPILDGEVVTSPNKTKRRYIEYILLFITILSTCVIVGIFAKPLKSSRSEAFYDDLIKQIAIPVAGEEVLDDPTSVAHKFWKALASAMPSLVENGVLQNNETEKITQRYTILVVASSASRNYLDNGEILPKDDTRLKMNFCMIMPCLDDGTLTGLILRNERVTNRGGGIMTREIHALYNLTYLIGTRSALQSTIPTEIGSLEHLQILNLRDNSFSGTIPTEIGQLKNLEFLLLDDNHFEGPIPSELGQLSKLKYLSVSRNKLSGSIPTELMFLTNLTSIALNGNDLVSNVDYLCHENLSNGTNIVEINAGRITIPIEVNLGLTIDCAMMGENDECECCICE